MPSASQTIRLRRLRQSREGHSPWLKLGLVSALLISLAAVVFSLVGVWYYVDLTHNLPSVEVLPALIEPPNGMLLQPSKLYDRNHEHVLLTLQNPSAQGKQYLYIGANSKAGTSLTTKYLIDATIAELDPGFWNEPGFKLIGVTEGKHSTLAQIIVTDLLLDGEPPSVKRNIRERILAAQVTAQYGREKVLEWFLNSARYGETLYGADAASRVYFGKYASDLSLPEAALLTAMAEKPLVNPLTGSQILKQQQEIIIQKMFASGLIDGDEALGALKKDVHFKDQVIATTLAPAYTALVLKQLSSMIPLNRVYRGGYDIVTALDYDLQLQADCAAKAQSAHLSGKQEATAAFDGSPCKASSLLPSLKDGIETRLDNTSPEVVILDPHTGQILAMVGADGSGMLPLDPPSHPAGTILSPLLYLTAFTRGMSPASLLWDIPNESANNTSIPVKNELNSTVLSIYHGPVSLREAFVNDYTGAAGDVWQQVGAGNVLLTEKQFGLSTPNLPEQVGTSLESYYSQSINLLKIMQSYSVLATQGIMAGQPNIDDTPSTEQVGLSPTSILKVESVDGHKILDWTIPGMVPVVTRQIAYLTTNVLSDQKARWSSLGHPNSLEIGRPAAAKVSVNAANDSAWVVGYVPQVAVGVWMGYSHGTQGGITADVPAGLWHAIIQYATNEMPVQDFSVPSGVSLVQVCKPSGLLVSNICPSIGQEVFLSGSEPTQVDNLYKKYTIDRETGLLATIFTPTERVEDKVFLAVPLEAEAWAKEAGMAIPPATYDSITAPQTVLTDVQISDPQMFDQVAEKINITGSAGGEDFLYYRLQVGQGLNPQKWLQIGEDVKSPVINGTLGTWDTTGLEGLYVVQLQVVRKNSRIDQANLQLTVDNTVPVVKILSPRTEEQYRYHAEMTIMLNVSVTDNLVVQRVEFYVDNKKEATLLESPYVIVWGAITGKHFLLVRAYDLAGNQSEATIPFVVSR
jgi:membrane peptidoglycan carboxypeptidase